MNDKSVTVQNSKNESINIQHIYCVGRNYVSHAEELKNSIPESPVFFQKSTACVNQGNLISIPQNSLIHHELEVVVLLKKNGYKINSSVNDYVDGIGLGLDMTDRGLQNHLKTKQLPWFLSKNFKNSTIMSDFLLWDDPLWKHHFWLKKNGETVQRGHINDMIYSIEKLIRFLSNRIPLMVGDVIFTGTPEGVGKITPGDSLSYGVGDILFDTIKIKA
jgi:acylpyruvate hydrolase